MERTDYHFREERSGRAEAPLLFAFHGTGGDENQIFDLARALLPEADLIAPRGDTMENGMRRFFRRKAEGTYDMEDVARQSERMAGFVGARAERIGAKNLLGIGYSNGANILATTMMRDPSLMDAAVLMHPLIPFDPAAQPGLKGRRILITAGRRDPICPMPETERFAEWLHEQGAEVETAWHDGGHEIRPEELQAARMFFAAVAA
ncbi:MAG TPA: alpha/beta hydrolase [Pararhizobium sp.]|nr:alpha/beta hydrolase [Pararhizobium sp.]